MIKKQNLSQINYRPEIDGLRAIAVFSVILYHTQFSFFGYQLFEGGFIGVDIFFVISGYLITSIILKELIVTGSFSFKNFYERRIRRIIPVLLIVMLVSLPFAWMYLVPNFFLNFSKSILFSLGFSSNFFFHHEGLRYGAEDGLLKPLLHTWSLSVEEQYYILFPIIFLFIFKFLKKYLFHFLILGFVLSLGLAEWGSKNYPTYNFYHLPTRGWELLAGSLLAYFEIILGCRNRNKTLGLIIPSVGFLLIIHSIIFFNDEMFHPSLYTLSPIIGVSLIIWFSDNKKEIVTKFLSSKLCVGTGLISYSLYLWHYPILVFAKITDISEGSIINKFLVGITIIVLSIFSYLLIEKPFRNRKYPFKNIIFIILITIAALFVFNLKSILSNGFEKRMYINDKYNLNANLYNQEYETFEMNYNYDNFDNRKNVLIVGNSHADDLLKVISYTNLNKKIYFSTISPKKRYCNYDYQINYLYKFLKEEKILINFYCKKFEKKIYDIKDGDFKNHLKKQYKKSDLIILSSRYFEDDLKNLDELIKLLKFDNKKIIIFDNALEISMSSSNLNRLDNYVFLNKKLPNNENLQIIEKNMFKDLENTKLKNLKIKFIAKNNNIPLIQRKEIFCDINVKKCPSITAEGYKIYWDYGHITNKGAEFFAKKIENDELFLKYLNSALNLNRQ